MLINFTDPIRLSRQWYAQPVPFEKDFLPQNAPAAWIPIAECTHLQPALYGEQPYWGERLRAINHQAWVYRHTFKKPAGSYKRVRLRFEGVDYCAEVWVNEHFAGRHEGGFAPFEFDITPFLDTENVTLTARVTAPWDLHNPSGTYPSDHVIRRLVKGLYEHGEGVIPPTVNPIGIWRPVWLLIDQGVSIDYLRIRTTLDGSVDLRLRLTNSTDDLWCGSLKLSVQADNHDGQGTEAYRPLALHPGTHILDQRLHIYQAHWWWPWDQGAPDLYRLDVLMIDGASQIIDTKHERFGMRTIRLERTPQRFTYWINERPVFVRGSSYIPSLYLSQCDKITLSNDIALAQQANLNLLRLHVHVSPPELYDLCDHEGMLIWQDFELNWVHDSSTQFEERACRLQREMIELLENHPSIITWSCHNEPTMVFARRRNLEVHPDPALYRAAQRQDPTRPVFLCSGQLDSDWQRSGDTHSYYGAIWSRHFTDIYRHRTRLATEFGFETPAALDTLRTYPEVWERLRHLEKDIDSLWAYQAALIQYHVEHFRRLRGESCAGYIQFWLADLVPQVGCGVLDACRVPKSGYEALRRASQPILPALEHDGHKPIALWVFNDTPNAYFDASIYWKINDSSGICLVEGTCRCDIQANASQRITTARWLADPEACAWISLRLMEASGNVLSENEYHQPFYPHVRPRGYPWKFDSYLGMKVFDRPGAESLADQNPSPVLRYVPLVLREAFTEWVLRQRLPVSLLTYIARVVDALLS